MSAYNPPTEPLPTFNSGVFTEASGTSTLTRDQADQLYLQYPIGQGQETLPALSTTGQVNVGTALSVGTTSQFTGDITLNKASEQTISCSSTTALNIKTTSNASSINLGVQSSTLGSLPDVLKVQANTNPKVTHKVLETQFTDSATTTYNTVITNTGGQSIFKNTSTAGLGGITLDASTSTAGAGAITLASKNGTPSTTTGLILTGTALTSATATGSSGQHLCLTINGTLYKIALLNA